MIRLLADENFNNDILHGLSRQLPELNVIRVQDTEVYQADDPRVLGWAAKENRILLTHDLRTIPPHAYERIGANLPMPGVFALSNQMPIAQAISELLLILGASDAPEWENLVFYRPV